MPAFAERPSALIRHARSRPDLYRRNASVPHRWNAALGACEVDLAGALLAGTLEVSPRARR